ncbi:MAG: hypothetical protein KGL67_02065 [Patescibacteria group bacterium]|nr:hypothetical protein [Patescibacteria group bacterium]
MPNKIKNSAQHGRKNSGFVELIVLIVIALLLMKYYNINVSTVLGWGNAFLKWFTSYFGSILK